MSLRIALAWSQWQSGIATSILSNTHVSIDYVECRWLLSLREALRATNASVRVDQDFVQGPERQGDVHIMDAARRSRRYSPDDLRRLNYCRLHLHVTTVSELLDPSGKVLHHMTKCKRPPWFDPTTITVLQTRPTSNLRLRQWENLCHHLATLPSPGPWIPNRQLRLRRETYVIPAPQCTIYHWHVGCYWECTLTDKSRSIYTLQQPTDWKTRFHCSTTPLLSTHSPTTLSHRSPITKPGHIPTIPDSPRLQGIPHHSSEMGTGLVSTHIMAHGPIPHDADDTRYAGRR